MLNMFSWDILERDWISAVHEMSYWINILVWGIIMHSVNSVAAFEDFCTRCFLSFSYGFTLAYQRQVEELQSHRQNREILCYLSQNLGHCVNHDTLVLRCRSYHDMLLRRLLTHVCHSHLQARLIMSLYLSFAL